MLACQEFCFQDTPARWPSRVLALSSLCHYMETGSKGNKVDVNTFKRPAYVFLYEYCNNVFDNTVSLIDTLQNKIRIDLALKRSLKIEFLNIFQSLFGKEADKLEQSNDDDKTCILFSNRGYTYLSNYNK